MTFADDPTLQIAERQLALLAELSALGMEAARAFTTSAVTSAKTAEVILKEDWSGVTVIVPR